MKAKIFINSYLNKFSPFRTSDKDLYNCVLKNENLKQLWCDTCNSGIGLHKNYCVNIITEEKHSDKSKKNNEI